MLRYLLHSNVMVEFSINPFAWYALPKIERAKKSYAFPKYRGFNFHWLFLRVYVYVDNGEIDVVAMYEQQMREQQLVEEA